MPRPTRFLECFEPEAGFTHLRVWPMTTEATAGKDWLHVLIEVEMLRSAHTRLLVVTTCGAQQQDDEL